MSSVNITHIKLNFHLNSFNYDTNLKVFICDMEMGPFINLFLLFINKCDQLTTHVNFQTTSERHPNIVSKI